MNYKLSLLVLLFTFIGLSSCSEHENSLFNMVQISGDYKKKECYKK